MSVDILRENDRGLHIMKDQHRLPEIISPYKSAFRARPCDRFAKLKRPTSTLDIDCRQFINSPINRQLKTEPNIQYRLWLEAGKHTLPFPATLNSNYNSNVWRNFRNNYGFITEADDWNLSEIIAAIYPLNIPPPSQVGNHTFHKYIAETKLYSDSKYKSMALKRSSTDMAEFRRLKLKSEQRKPLLDERGNILPPDNFKRHVQKLLPPPPPKPDTLDAGLYRVDMFGQIARVKTEPNLWKLSHKLNHPSYKNVREAITQRKELQEKLKSINQGSQLAIKWGKIMQEV